MDGYFLDRRALIIRAGNRRFELQIPDPEVLAHDSFVGAEAQVVDEEGFALKLAQSIQSLIEMRVVAADPGVDIIQLGWDAEARQFSVSLI